MTDGDSASGLLASGREADVFRFGERRVLRRYRDGSSAAPEVDLMRYVGDHGYPVPVVHEVDGPDLIMDLVEGPTMMAALQAGTLGVVEAAHHLADLHNVLHAVPTPAGVPADQRVVHLDLHPLNVIMSGRGPVVIDWRYGRLCPVALDVAMTGVILAEGATNAGDPRRDLLRSLLLRFLAGVDGDPRSELDQAVERRSTDFPGEAHRVRFESAARFVRECAQGRAAASG